MFWSCANAREFQRILERMHLYESPSCLLTVLLKDSNFFFDVLFITELSGLEVCGDCTFSLSVVTSYVSLSSLLVKLVVGKRLFASC